MIDPRHETLAELIMRHCCAVRAGDKVLIEAYDTPVEFLDALVRAVYARGGLPLVEIKYNALLRTLLQGATEASLALLTDCERYRMEQVDCFVGVRGWANPKDLSDLSPELNAMKNRLWFEPVHIQTRVPRTRWVVLRYPTQTMAYMANMSTSAFADYYYSVTTGVDYGQMSTAMDAAVAFLQGADAVHISGPGTDLRFSIKGMGVIKCDGLRNMPDGEIYTCPVRDSVQGVVRYNTPSTYDGFTFKDVCLRFVDGQIVEATANDTARLNHILDTDPGARYIGEFALGCNPRITAPMDETLFDEKIAGSFHFTPGNAYQDSDNGNRSAVHWDLVCIQTPEAGGGEIRIDGELIRRDGVFVHPAFVALNPENLCC